MGIIEPQMDHFTELELNTNKDGLTRKTWKISHKPA